MDNLKYVNTSIFAGGVHSQTCLLFWILESPSLGNRVL